MIEERVEDLSSLIVGRPGSILLVFAVLTVVFGSGLASISTETGTSQFSEGTPAQEALESVNSDFGSSFSSSSASTQLIMESQNVLSKKSLLEMLRFEKRLVDSGIPVSSVSSPADIVANALDPNASSYDGKIDALERASPSNIDSAIKRLESNPAFKGLVSNDFNAQSGHASAMLGSVSHPFEGSSSGGPGGGGSQIQEVQNRIDRVSGDIDVFGQGIISGESQSVIFDSLIIVVPAASVFIVFFLVYSYRDPIDLGLGVVSLVLAIVWTFGFMGLAGIPFSQMLISVPPLLLAVGIDFGIHAVNRYKEERLSSGVKESMDVALRQLLIAFLMVSGTTVIGFLSNLTSSLPPIRDFGLVAGIGITFTTLIFGIFLPAGKVFSDRKRKEYGIPIFGNRPVGAEDSFLGRLLPLTAKLGSRPYFSVMVFVLFGAFVGNYGLGVDTSFSQEDFLPPEDVPDVIEGLPEPFAPGDYSATGKLNFIDDRFSGRDSVTLYVDGPLRDHTVLEEVVQRSESVPSSFVVEEGEADYDSLVGVLNSVSRSSPQFKALLDRSDVDGDGIPERNVEKVFDTLFDVAPDSASRYLSEDYRSTRVDYKVESSSSQKEVTVDSGRFADRFRISAIATGTIIVFQGISEMILSSALNALFISLGVSLVFLTVMYKLVFDKPFLAFANMFPVVLTLSLIVGTMRYLGVPLNALTATILSITIGLGVDYSVHVTHRFEDELKHGDTSFEALKVTLRGTGGALTSSMLTTVTGIGVLVLAITPILGQFGLITGISILYSYLSSLIALPPALMVWYRLRG